MVDWWNIFMKLSGMKQNVFLKSLKQTKEKVQLGISQRQVVIKLLEKNGGFFVVFFLSRFSFTNIHDSRDSRGRGRVSI